jgi:general secretion pathway protein D
LIRYLTHTFFILLLMALCCSSPALASGKGVVLNFNEVDISTMVKFISDLTGKNFVLDDRVKGKISVYSPSKLSNEEAYNVFVSVLELKGFAVVQSGKVAKIVPSATAKQSGFALLPSGELAPSNENYVALVSKLENITAQEAQTFLQPMISKDGHISAFGPGNMILMVDSSINIRKLQGILQTIDSGRTREGVEVLYLKNASAETIAPIIRQWLSGGDSKQQAGQSGTSAGSIIADPRLNALLILGSDTIKKSVRDMVAKLDVAPPEASSKVNVFYLENADATEVAKVLDGVMKGTVAAAVPGQAGALQASPFESNKITITPDKATNSLVIMASPNDYASLLQVIKKLDRRNKQVFVQVLIAEVSMDKARDIGVEAGVLGGYVANNFAVAGFYDPFSTFANMVSAIQKTGITNSNLNFDSPANITAALHALDKNGLLNVLSTPNILTSDNKEAEIFVGENVPFKGNSAIVGTNIVPSVERKDTGISLKIKPQVSEGDYVKMDIYQEISAVKDAVGNAVDISTTKRSAKTNITVKDKETVVIGGLIQERETESVSKVPFLGDIPGLGWLFKTKSKKREKTNLMILLTPRIVKDAADLADVSGTQRSKFGDSARSIEPVNVQKEISGK